MADVFAESPTSEKEYCKCGCTSNEALVQILNILWQIPESERSKILESVKSNTVSGRSEGPYGNMVTLHTSSAEFASDLNKEFFDESNEFVIDDGPDLSFEQPSEGQIVPLGPSSQYN